VVEAAVDLLPANWTVQNEDFLIISWAGRGENIDGLRPGEPWRLEVTPTKTLFLVRQETLF
jgi:hypothetical protein